MRFMIGLCALLLAGCAERNPVSPAVIEPSCRIPAPLYLQADSISIANSYIVIYPNDIADAASVTSALKAKYGFSTRYQWSGPKGIKGFVATLDPARVAALRCEPAVAYIEREMIYTLD